MSRQYTCKKCGVSAGVFMNRGFLIQHYKDVHGGIAAPQGCRVPNAKSEPTSPYDIIHKAEQEIKKAVSGLEDERDRLHQRIIELDNLIFKYNGKRTTVT